MVIQIFLEPLIVIDLWFLSLFLMVIFFLHDVLSPLDHVFTCLFVNIVLIFYLLIYYEKLRPSKPHYHATKTQKTTHTQLLCNYLLGITTIVQLSPKNTVY